MSKRKRNFLDELLDEIDCVEENIAIDKEREEREQKDKEFYEEQLSDVIVDYVLDQILDVVFPGLNKHTEDDQLVTTKTLGDMFGSEFKIKQLANQKVLEKVVIKLYKILNNTPVSFWNRIPEEKNMLWSTNITLVQNNNKYSKYYGDGDYMVLANLPLKKLSENDYGYDFGTLCFGNFYKYFKDYYYDDIQKYEYKQAIAKQRTRKKQIPNIKG